MLSIHSIYPWIRIPRPFITTLPSRLINGDYQSLRRESLPVEDSSGADHHSRPDDGKADGEDGQEVGVVPGGLGRNGTRTLLTILAVPRRRHRLMAPLAVGNLYFRTIVRPGVLLQRGLGEVVGHCAVVMRNEETCPLRQAVARAARRLLVGRFKDFTAVCETGGARLILVLFMVSLGPIRTGVVLQRGTIFSMAIEVALTEPSLGEARGPTDQGLDARKSSSPIYGEVVPAAQDAAELTGCTPAVPPALSFIRRPRLPRRAGVGGPTRAYPVGPNGRLGGIPAADELRLRAGCLIRNEKPQTRRARRERRCGVPGWGVETSPAVVLGEERLSFVEAK
jgi:hypothetical protein